MASSPPTSPPWDLFCRVVDNHGDLGVCWRLAADLAGRGQPVRLWLDDARALAWMAPQGAPGVQVVPWTNDAPALTPGPVVIEAFGCDPPPDFVTAMAALPTAPVWVNLEYLSAEAYVERSHRLPSPQFAGPGRGLTKWFFYPGFTPDTGGLLREPGLGAVQAAFDAAVWLKANGIDRRPGERLVSLFCYPHADVPALVQRLSDAPTLLLTTPGAATHQVATLTPPPHVRTHALPWLAQPDYDRLLWSCDLNLVRGEDSFVRAQWAGAPFLWHIYPQHDRAHEAKLGAFLARHLAGAEPALATAVAGWMRAWNGMGQPPAQWPDMPAWAAHGRAWRDALRAQTDLATQLLAFVTEKR